MLHKEAVESQRESECLSQPIRKCLNLIGKYRSNSALIDSFIVCCSTSCVYFGMPSPVPQHSPPRQYGGGVIWQSRPKWTAESPTFSASTGWLLIKTRSNSTKSYATRFRSCWRSLYLLSRGAWRSQPVGREHGKSLERRLSTRKFLDSGWTEPFYSQSFSPHSLRGEVDGGCARGRMD